MNKWTPWGHGTSAPLERHLLRRQRDATSPGLGQRSTMDEELNGGGGHDQRPVGKILGKSMEDMEVRWTKTMEVLCFPYDIRW